MDLKVKMNEFINKVCDWFDRLKIKFNGKKNQIIKLSLILKIM